MKRGKTEMATEAYQKWVINKEKQEKTEKIIKKFRKDLELMQGVEEERPWRWGQINVIANLTKNERIEFLTLKFYFPTFFW